MGMVQNGAEWECLPTYIRMGMVQNGAEWDALSYKI
jgi:hypothetical protein